MAPASNVATAASDNFLSAPKPVSEYTIQISYLYKFWRLDLTTYFTVSYLISQSLTEIYCILNLLNLLTTTSPELIRGNDSI